ncbi:Hypothetical protein R9X50_00634600 [Acrodontium crateriforme]|uniref:Poly(A) polymerase n=1 Tax=Acrodontium crateriforme TaxID=150365 RepID=A0AAQ3RBI9_9PEZI|nr:Hypothetical protein R9X50_00634600 [Acrodontium crateriforme]
MSGAPHLGVTPPMSTAPPTERELKLTDTLIQELKTQNNFAPDDDVRRREDVIKKLEGLLRRMVQIVGKEKGLPQSILDVAGGKVFTFGSYRLGVFGPGSDVDTLMLAPKHVTRQDFFAHMPKMLKESPELGEVSEPNPVPGISVPIIKVEIQGVDIDLIFSNIQQSSIPDNFTLDDTNLLRGLDMEDIRSLNGTRVTNRILQLVPQPRTFRYALRAIKLWAQRRAIYGNIVGFPGGVAYAMMVARVCQLYPMAAAPLIVTKFFYIMGHWNWPSPVRLQAKEDVPFQLREWDPQTSRGDAAHLMPVITPAYPIANSTHTITESTKKIMLQELERGFSIMTEINEGKQDWSELFQRHTFFTDTYKHFICVITAAKTEKAQMGWTGFVQSRVKFLAGGIERSDARSVDVVQPYNKGFDRVHKCHGEEQIEQTLDGSLEYQVKEIKTRPITQKTDEVKAQVDATSTPTAQTDEAETRVDAKSTPAAQTDTVKAQVDSKSDAQKAEETDIKDTNKTDGSQYIYSTTYLLGIGLKKGSNSLDISMPISEFKQDVQNWNQYDDQMHSIRIKYIRNYDLPDDVFVEGEVRPTRKKKAKGSGKKAGAAENKRSFTNSGLDETGASAKRQQLTKGSNAHNTSNGTTPTNGLVAAKTNGSVG